MNIHTGDGKVLPFRQVSDGDSCRRINSAVMKIRLFKPKKVFNSPAHFCLKGNNLHNRRSRPADEDTTNICCLKGRTTAVAQMNICNGEKRTNKMKIRNLKSPLPTSPLLLYYPLLFVNCQLIHNTPRLRRYPSYLKRGVDHTWHITVPLR